MAFAPSALTKADPACIATSFGNPKTSPKSGRAGRKSRSVPTTEVCPASRGQLVPTYHFQRLQQEWYCRDVFVAVGDVVVVGEAVGGLILCSWETHCQSVSQFLLV
jgi:hypothetical protein